MKVEFAADFPVTDAACKKSTGKSLKEWFKEIDSREDLNTKRREAIPWMYGLIGITKDVWWPTKTCVFPGWIPVLREQHWWTPCSKAMARPVSW